MFLHFLVADVEIFMKNVTPLVIEFSVCFSDVSEFSSTFNLALHVALSLGIDNKQWQQFDVVLHQRNFNCI